MGPIARLMGPLRWPDGSSLPARNSRTKGDPLRTQKGETAKKLSLFESLIWFCHQFSRTF